MSIQEWIAWAIGLAIAVALGVIAWRWPRSPRQPAAPPPELRLEQVDGLGYGKGSPTEHVKAKLRLVNDGHGEARGWQVSITNPTGRPVKLARLPHRGPMRVASTVSWHQDASTGTVPAQQDRELPDWLWVEAPPTTLKLSLPLSIKADGMATRQGQLLVTLPSGPGGPSVEINL